MRHAFPRGGDEILAPVRKAIWDGLSLQLRVTLRKLCTAALDAEVSLAQRGPWRILNALYWRENANRHGGVHFYDPWRKI